MDWIRELWERFGAGLHALLDWVEGLADGPSGPAALFAIAFAESSFFPIPPDVLLIALCLGDPDRWLYFALLCTAGSVIGGMAGYGLGYWGGRPLLVRWFAPARIARVKRYYDRYNAWATGIAGLTPLPYKLFTISGGAFAVDLRIFVVASILARGLRFVAVAGLIRLWGEAAQLFIEKYLNVLTVAFVVLLIGGFWALGRWGSRGEADEGERQ
jgi:membrane protein YqaA with SNARE-associated domain